MACLCLPQKKSNNSGSEKGVFWKRGLFRKVEHLEILEILEIRQTVENKGESDDFLEILENLEILEILENSSSEKTPFVMTPFLGPNNRGTGKDSAWPLCTWLTSYSMEDPGLDSRSNNNNNNNNNNLFWSAHARLEHPKDQKSTVRILGALARIKKGPLCRFSACFPVFKAKKGPRKICAKPWLPVIRA